MINKQCILVIAALGICFSANAQSILGRLTERAKNAAENAVGNKIENAIYDGVDKAASKKEKESKKDSSSKSTSKSSKDGWACPECGKTGNTGISVRTVVRRSREMALLLPLLLRRRRPRPLTPRATSSRAT